MSRRSFARALAAATLVGATLVAPQARASTSELTYATMSDGVRIALAVGYPDGFDPAQVGEWPVLFMMDGYAGGAGVIDPKNYGHRYVTVHASIRGTGCSSGRFDLFDRRHAEDGYEIIEGWVQQQGWANGDVGIVGHSYPGLTGFLVASTDPPHLRAIAISGLIDDLYRGIVYPGGVPNYGFPAVWTLGYRPASELSGNAGRYSSDPECAVNIAQRPAFRDPLDEGAIQGLTSQEDETWWRVRSLVTYIRGITKPIHITQQYQDEQTGPRGGHVLWQRIPESVPKRLVVTNGVHSTTGIAAGDRLRWLNCWMLGECDGDILERDTRVQVYFETQRPASGFVTNPPVTGSDWPLPQTEWTRYYLRANGTLATAMTGDDEGAATPYVSLPSGRQTALTLGMGFGNDGIGRLTYAGGPDEATWRLAFEQDTAIAGPAMATLWMTSTGINTDLFVDVIDRWPNGRYEYIQRGMLRASHRAVDPLRSDRVAAGPHAGEMYRPWHPHTNPTSITPTIATEYAVEIFPFGHVFRTGHELVLKLHAPPPVDPLSIYVYPSPLPPAVNQILHGEAYPSSILLPVQPELPAIATPAACGAQVGVPCFEPVA